MGPSVVDSAGLETWRVGYLERDVWGERGDVVRNDMSENRTSFSYHIKAMSLIPRLGEAQVFR